MRQCERDDSCFDHLSPCWSQFYSWLPRRIRQQRRGYASGGIFTTAEADFTTTESTRKQVPCGPGERSRQSHMGQGLPPICIRPAIRFIANAPLATRAGVVSSVVVRAISSKTHNGARDRELVHEAFETKGVLIVVHAAPEPRRDWRIDHRVRRLVSQV